MKPASRNILEKIENNKDGFVVFTTTNNIEDNPKDLERLLKYYEIEEDDYDYITELENKIAEHFASDLFNNLYPNVIAWKEISGYANGKLNENSFIILVDASADIEKFIEHLNENLPSSGTIVFPASSKYIKFNKPVEDCSYVEGHWIKYDLRDEYYIKPKRYYSESKSIVENVDLLIEAFNNVSREELLMTAYERAPRYYNPISYNDPSFSVEDFKQETYLTISQLYREKDPRLQNVTRDTMDSVIDGIMRKDVILPLRRKHRRDLGYSDIDDIKKPYEDNSPIGSIDSLSDVLTVDQNVKPGYVLTPDEQYEMDSVYGKLFDKDNLKSIDSKRDEIFEELLQNFSVTPYKTNRYIYEMKGEEGILMSPAIIATLILEGNTLNEIADLFMPETDIEGNPVRDLMGKNYLKHSSPGVYIDNKFQLIRRQLSKMIKDKPIDEQLVIYNVLLYIFNQRTLNEDHFSDEESLISELNK